MEARSFGSTPINMAQHSYFNLDGSASGTTVLDHVVEMPNACALEKVMSVQLPYVDMQHALEALRLLHVEHAPQVLQNHQTIVDTHDELPGVT